MLSYFRISSYSTVLIYLYATSRSNVTKLCNFIANRIFRTLLTFLLFWSCFFYTAFFLRDISIICYITVISNYYAILLYTFPLTLYLALERFLFANNLQVFLFKSPSIWLFVFWDFIYSSIIILYIAEFFPRVLSRLLHQPFVEGYGCPFLRWPLGKDRQEARAANNGKIPAQFELLNGKGGRRE